MHYSSTPTRLAMAMCAFTLGSIALSSSAAILEEVVVTAQKREQNLQDVGLAVTAFSGEQLSALGYSKTEDIAAQTPGLTVAQNHPTITTLNIRGVSQNDYADGYEAPVAVFVDGAYVASMGAASSQLYDIERVEVLRGPQGTLFGRNATGGVVHYVSVAPSVETTGFSNFTIGNYGTRNFSGAIGGSLTDSLQGRLSLAVNKNDGLLKNRIGPDMRDTDARSVRLQLAWQPSEDLDLSMKLHHSKDDANGNGYQHSAAISAANGLGENVPGPDLTGYEDTDNDPHAGDYDNVGFFRREINGVSVKAEYDLSDSLKLVSITDFNAIRKDYAEDGDSGPFPFLSLETIQAQDQFSQELQLSSESDKLRWQAGVYYLDIDNKFSPKFVLDFHPFGAAPDYGLAVQVGVATATITTESSALYGQAEYDLDDSLTVVLGARYTRDTRGINYFASDPFAASGITTLQDQGEIKFSNWSYKAQLDWRATDDTLVFAGITKTHKAGNFQVRGDDPLGFIPHDQEELLSFEAGIKTQILDGLARFNATAFVYDYKDYQAFFTDPLFGATGTTLIQNLDATVQGAELELVMNPVQGLDVLLGVSYLDSTVKDVVFPTGELIDGALPNAPKYSINGLIRYGWEMAGGEAALQLDFNHSDDFAFSVLAPPIDQEAAYTVFNARASYSLPEGNWTAALFVSNLTDEEYRAYALDVSALGLSESIFAPPRMYGLSVDYTF